MTTIEPHEELRAAGPSRKGCFFQGLPLMVDGHLSYSLNRSKRGNLGEYAELLLIHKNPVRT